MKNIRTKILVGCILLLGIALNAQNNYVRTYTATAPINSPSTLVSAPLTDMKMVTQYSDGLGRPIQTVAKQGSLETSNGTPVDLISTIGYDYAGRNNTNYLPYPASSNDGSFKTDALSAQPNFYNSTSILSGQGEYGAYARSGQQFEESPLNRVVTSLAPGNNWLGSGRGVVSNYWVNTSTDDVKAWYVSNSGTIGIMGSYYVSGSYPEGSLYKNSTKDENGHQVLEFKDRDGKVLLKKVQNTTSLDDGTGSGYAGWLCTFYVYDDLGNLRCVIQPSAVANMASYGWSLSQTMLDEQCFRYEYDGRNRMIIKKVPGAGEVDMVYDYLDRLVMTQDANMRNIGKWMVTVYDSYSRPVQTGLLSNWNSLYTHYYAAYNSSSYPSTSSGYELLTQTHYDDYVGLVGVSAYYNYSWNSNLSSTSSYFPYQQMPSQTSTGYLKGLVTWTMSKVLNNDNPTTNLYSSHIFDDKARVIQTQSQNITGGIDYTTTEYTWMGQPYTVVQSQEKAGNAAQTTVTVSRMNYDNLNRLLSTTKQVQNTLINYNNMSAINTVSSMQYDALGQLKTKNLGNTRPYGYYSSTPLETLNYDYNIRGWLLGINRAYVQDVSTANNAYNSGEIFSTPTTFSAGNYFGFELGYDKNPIVGSSSWNSSLQYNGNITGTIWKSAHDKQIRKFDYSYDAANRITLADFNQYTYYSFNKNAGLNFSVSNLTYDENGNIKTMNQMGMLTPASSSSITIDNLYYNYIGGSNKLSSVNDAANYNTPSPGSTSYLGDFHYNTSGSAATYSYDANGNLTADGNKNISSISYNYLNLPQTISVSGKGTIAYIYDASGNKLQKTTTEGSTVTTTVYASGIVFQNDVLQFITQEEGRIRPDSYNTGYVFDYYLKDHLGNTRMTITDDYYSSTNPVLDATSYYPFGLTMAGISWKKPNVLENRFRYNGKELQSQEFSDKSGLELYDYGNRMFDQQIGRWHKTDNKAELYQNTTPYAYAANQPTNAIDPDGNLVIFINGMHTGDGGKPHYWRRTVAEKTLVTSTSTGINSFGIPSFIDKYKTITRQENFDLSVMDRFNDHKTIQNDLQYLDGALGGNKAFPLNMSEGLREGMGHEYGKVHVEEIINSLEHTGGVITETLKIVTHSMGGAYGKGFVQAVIEWAKANPEKAKGLNIAVYDFAPFQQNEMKAVAGATTYQFDNSGDMVVGYGLFGGSMFNKQKGVEDRNKTGGGGHSIFNFLNRINQLETGKYVYQNGQFVRVD